jgi:hypothetical protein
MAIVIFPRKYKLLCIVLSLFYRVLCCFLCVLIKSSVDITLLSFVNMDPRWKHPFTALVVGPTQSGKTVFTFKFIREARKLIHPPPEKIVYCYGEFQPIFSDYKSVTFHDGLPDLKQFDGKYPTLLVIDDLMSETNQSVSNIFTVISHHRNVSVMYLS